MHQHSKGDLIWWHAPSQKFWGIVSRVYKRHVYIVHDCGGMMVAIGTISPATELAVVRHQKKQFGELPAVTRRKIAKAKEFIR